MNHKDDILETALNSGIKFAAEKYDVSENLVRQIVVDFKNDNGDEDICQCQKSMRETGMATMCFMCPGPKTRIKI